MLTIFATALFFYAPLLISSFSVSEGDLGKRKLILGVFNSIVSMPSAFNHRSQFNLFDFGYMLTFCMMIC